MKLPNRVYDVMKWLVLICIPAFTDIEIDGSERTAIKLIVEPR